MSVISQPSYCSICQAILSASVTNVKKYFLLDPEEYNHHQTNAYKASYLKGESPKKHRSARSVSSIAKHKAEEVKS